MKTLFVSDLDGTLLGADGRLSRRSESMLNELARRGVAVAAATARTPATLEPLLHNVRTGAPAIVMTGAAMWDRNRKCYLEKRLMADKVASRAVEICRDNGVNPFIYSLKDDGFLDVWHNGRCNIPEERFIAERRHLHHKCFHLDSPEGLAETIPSCILIFAIGPCDPIFRAAEEIEQRVEDCSVSAYMDVYTPSTGILEVFARGISKAAALKRLKEIYGADRVVVFGDNLNDIPMMQVADESWAVENALDPVKEIATGVIGPNTADSVPEKIASISGCGDLVVC